MTTDQEHPNWGMLGPEHTSSTRRVRTLEVGAAVRTFNDLAVPGMGGVWFGKQLMLATLGVAVAQSPGSRAKNIETANAIEALACWWTLDKLKWPAREARLKGANKLRGVTKGNLTFGHLRKPSAYVSQPMRMTTVQPLRALGLVESTQDRFSSFACSVAGRQFLELAFEGSNSQKPLIEWVLGGDLPGPKLLNALAPIEPLPTSAREFLRERLCTTTDSATRRRTAALAWVEQCRSATIPATWGDRPAMLDADHWADLQEGALFFDARQAALKLLDAIERLMNNQTGARTLRLERPLPQELTHAMEVAQRCGREFLDRERDSTGGIAKTFCTELVNPDEVSMLCKLVARDGRVLVLRGSEVMPGAGFGALSEDSGDTALEQGNAPEQRWPHGMSPRIGNLFLMNLDLHDELGAWLKRKSAEANLG